MSITKRINYEIIKREQAFQLYKKLKNLKAVSEVPGMPSYSVLLKWKEEDNWDGRIEKTQEKLEKWELILSRLENDSLLKDDVFHLMLLNNLLERTLRAIIEKDLEPSSWKEAMETLKMIFEQKRLLLGRATSKSEVDIDFTGMDEYEIRETLRRINELLQSAGSPHTPEEKVKRLVKEKIELEKALEDKTEDKENIEKQAKESLEKEMQEAKAKKKEFLKDLLEEE